MEPIVVEVVDLGAVVVTVAVGAGPRILGFARPGRPQLFAQLPDEVIETPGVGTFRFLGGHRLWRAPEVPTATYQPDDGPVAIREVERGVELRGPPDRDGIVRSIAVHLVGDVALVDHPLRNAGATAVALAPWAITQLAPGGTAFVPQPTREPGGALPDRVLALWPYTDPADPALRFEEGMVRVTASRAPTRTKFGQPNRRGWLAYHLDGELFLKWAPRHDDRLRYVDLGSSAECYRDERFLELETLGPLRMLAPGDEARHREAWQLREVAPEELDGVLAALPSWPRQADV